ncbi:hypothetical protein YC2023_072683 [Brassica napus]
MYRSSVPGDAEMLILQWPEFELRWRYSQLQGLQGQPLNAVTTAAGFAVFQGIIFQGELSFFTCIYIMNQVHKHFFVPPFLTKLGERFSKPSPEDPFYTRSRTMLLKLARSREVREELQEKTFNRSYVAFAH